MNAYWHRCPCSSWPAELGLRSTTLHQVYVTVGLEAAHAATACSVAVDMTRSFEFAQMGGQQISLGMPPARVIFVADVFPCLQAFSSKAAAKLELLRDPLQGQQPNPPTPLVMLSFCPPAHAQALLRQMVLCLFLNLHRLVTSLCSWLSPRWHCTCFCLLPECRVAAMQQLVLPADRRCSSAIKHCLPNWLPSLNSFSCVPIPCNQLSCCEFVCTPMLEGMLGVLQPIMLTQSLFASCRSHQQNSEQDHCPEGEPNQGKQQYSILCASLHQQAASSASES